jgi:hypothetical protein
MDPTVVEAILQQALRWSSHELGGYKRDAGDFPGTKIAVLKGTGTHPPEDRDDLCATYSGYKKLVNATAGKAHDVSGDDDQIRDDN